MSNWAQICDFPDYAVSSDGRIMRITTEANTQPGRILIPSSCGKSRYLAVLLYRNGERKLCTVHRLVAKAFVPNPHDKPQVNHCNGKRFDNHSSNLEWVTASENRKHAFRTGLQTPVRGESHGGHRINKIERQILAALGNGAVSKVTSS